MIEWLTIVHFDTILCGLVGLVALWLSIETLRDIHKTKRLLKEKELRETTISEHNSNDSVASLVIDDCYLSANSSPYMKIGVLRYD